MNVAVVGAGPVGVASAAVYALGGHRVSIVERSAERVALLRRGALPFFEEGLSRAWRSLAGAVAVVPSVALCPEVPQVVVCCVGTPSLPDGSADLSQLDAVLGALEGLPPCTLVVRSTVPPGTGRRLLPRLRAAGHGYASHPEFLQEGSALRDTVQPSRLVVGADDPEPREAVYALYPDATCPRVSVDIPTAEFIKVATNAHLAMRVSYINEMALLADRLGADIDAVAEGVGLDPRIGRAYLRAGLGYGGSCFPKDTRALTALARGLDEEMPLLRAVIEINARQPVLLAERLRTRLGGLRGRRLGLWGLAFKPGTNDMRESQAVRLLELLCADGAEVAVHDPVAVGNGHLPAGAVQVPTALDAVAGAQAVVLATEWPEYRGLRPEEVAGCMAAPRLLLDARNVLPPHAWTAAGIDYCGVGRHHRRPAAEVGHVRLG